MTSKKNISQINRKRKRNETTNDTTVEDEFIPNEQGSFLSFFSDGKQEQVAKVDDIPPQPIIDQKTAVEDAFKISQGLLASSTSVIEKEKYQAIYTEMQRLWKQSICSDWCEERGHECSAVVSECTTAILIKHKKAKNENPREIARLEEAHSNCNDCLSNTLNMCEMTTFVASVYDLPSANNEIHVCYEPQCKTRWTDRELHYTLWKTIDWVFFCKRTGNMHVCDQFCNARKIPDSISHEMVCSISRSGSMFEKVVITYDSHSWSKHTEENESSRGESLKSASDTSLPKSRPYANNNNDNNINNKTLSLEEVLAQCTSIGFVEAVLKNQKAIKQKDQKKIEYNPVRMPIKSKEDALIVAICQVCIPFSQQKLAKLASQKQLVGKELEASLNTTCSRAYQDRTLPNVQLMHMNVDIILKQRYLPPDLTNLESKPETRRQLILHFAQQCVIFWHILFTHTKFCTTNSFQFRDFIESALCIFADGIEVTKEDHDPPFTLIKKQDLLSILSPNEMFTTIESSANTKPKRDKPSRYKTPIENEIKSSLLTTVRKQEIQPTLLRLDYYQYGQIGNEAFSLSKRKFPRDPNNNNI